MSLNPSVVIKKKKKKKKVTRQCTGGCVREEASTWSLSPCPFRTSSTGYFFREGILAVFLQLKTLTRLGVVVHTCDHNTHKAEAGGLANSLGSSRLAWAA